jgi:hypothetical protein
MPGDGAFAGEGTFAGEGAFARLPGWMRPRGSEAPGRGRLWRVEAALLLLAALVLLTATIYDLTREARINRRFNADIATWQLYTGHQFRELSIDTTTLGYVGERDIVCGNTSFGEPGQRTQICLEIYGKLYGRTPARLRKVYGGWYLPPRTQDALHKRYGCFGRVSHTICLR